MHAVHACGCTSMHNGGEGLQRRRRAEADRRERVFDDKVRTIGIDKEALDMQIIEKRKQEEAAEKEQKAYDAEMLHNSRVSNLLHRRQQKEKRAAEEAVVAYQRQWQWPRSQRERNLDDPTRGVEMMLPGLTGEDPEWKSRQREQKDQLRRWLIQQQSEQRAQRRQEKLQDQLYDHAGVEMANKAAELHGAEAQARAAAAVATKEFNLATVEEKKRRGHLEGPSEASWSRVGVPGLRSERRTSPERLQHMALVHKHQMEEKRRKEAEAKREEERQDRARLDSARAAALLERRRARASAQLRRELDRTNAHLAEAQRERRPDIDRGRIDDSFFAQFNTSSR